MEHLRRRDCVRIFYSGENVFPDLNVVDYAISTIKLACSDRVLWMPAGMKRNSTCPFWPKLRPLDADMTRRPFCSFLYSNDSLGQGARCRREFCQYLMQQYAHVDCPGRILHNVDIPELSDRYALNWDVSKLNFLSRYKFHIAWENSDAPGYITEKLTDCFIANTVPIYWGSGGDVAPFPKEAMICANDYPDVDALVARIREVNENDELYMSLLAANPLRNGMSLLREDLVADFLRHILLRGRVVLDKDPGRLGAVAQMERLANRPSALSMRLMRCKERLKRLLNKICITWSVVLL